jgi:AAA domain-containing protein
VTDPVANPPEPTRAEQFAAKLLTVAALLTMEPPEPLIGDLLAHNSLAVLYGPPGSYKTFVALDWALCIAGGLPWQGRGVRAGPVLYVAAEGSAGLGARVEAWVEGFRADPPARFRAYPDTVNLREAGQRDTLAEWATTDRPGLVVFDTLARSMVGGDENSARDMGELIDGAEQVRAASGATVLLVHHTTKDGTSIRGSSALQGAADSLVEAKADGRLVTLSCAKQKDAASFEPVRLRAEPVALAKGSSVVLRAFEGLQARAANERHEQAILQTLQTEYSETGASNKTLREGMYLGESTVSRAVNALLKRGAIVNVGPKGRPIWKVATP